MHMPAWTLREPGAHLGVLVARVVVRDAVHVQFRRHRPVDFAQEGKEFLMPMARFASCQDRAIEDIQCCEKRGRSMTDVVVRDALDVAESHWQQRLRALQRLTLTLLVNAQHQRVLRRIQI